MAAPSDYGPRGGRRKASHTRSEPAVPGWMWLLVGLSAGLAIAAGVYISRPTEDTAAATPARAPAKREPEPAKPQVPPENKRWLFYDLLEDYELVVPPDPEGDAPTPRSKPEAGSYIIQVGSFPDMAGAERQRARLLLLDIESRIRKVTIEGRKTWYRVQVGPLRDGERIVEILERLDENGIDSLLIREKA